MAWMTLLFACWGAEGFPVVLTAIWSFAEKQELRELCGYTILTIKTELCT
jgi:hypothetical protein